MCHINTNDLFSNNAVISLTVCLLSYAYGVHLKSGLRLSFCLSIMYVCLNVCMCVLVFNKFKDNVLTASHSFHLSNSLHMSLRSWTETLQMSLLSSIKNSDPLLNAGVIFVPRFRKH